MRGDMKATRKPKSFRSTIKRRAKDAPCPVPAARLNTILAPVDFSDCSRCAVHEALRLARSFKAKLILLYVAETVPAGADLGASHLPQVESELREMGRKQLARLRRKEIPDQVTVALVVRAGRPEVEILDEARSRGADLIVMATHSHDSPPGHLGSTAERVVRAASCPVVLVPVHEKCVPFFL